MNVAASKEGSFDATCPMNEMVWKQEYQVEKIAFAMTAIILNILSFPATIVMNIAHFTDTAAILNSIASNIYYGMLRGKKMNFYFASEICDCLNLFGEPIAVKTCYNFICNDSAQFQIAFSDLAEVRVSSSNLLTSSVRRISRLEG